MNDAGNQSLKVAFIGAGDIAQMHAEAVAAVDGAVLRGVYNRKREKAVRLASEFDCQTYDSIDAVCIDEKVDAVYVLTNLETHVPFALQAIKAGKHVLVEKPVAPSSDDIERLRLAAENAGVWCAPVHNYIYEPGLARTKRLLESGKLGDIVSLYMMYNIHHPESVCAKYPGVIRQILTHHAYTMIYLAGNPTSVSAMKATVNDGSVEQENLAMVNCQLASGGLAHLSASFAADDHAGDPWTCVVKVIGTQGATRFSYRDWVENQPGVVHSHTFSAYPFGIENVTQHFLNQTIRCGNPPLSTLADAVMAAKVVEAAEQSAIAGQIQIG